VSGLSPNNDKVGHGTGVAGTIGAKVNNGIGTVGINWNATILPVKGDNLTKIALKFYGDGSRWYEIYEMNKAIIGANPSYLKIGTVLTIKAVI